MGLVASAGPAMVASCRLSWRGEVVTTMDCRVSIGSTVVGALGASLSYLGP